MLIITTLLVVAVYIYLGSKRPGIALITSPFIAGTLIIVAVTQEDIVALCVAPFVFVATLVTALLSKRKLDSDGWSETLAKIIVGGLGLSLPVFLLGYSFYLAFEVGIVWPLVLSVCLILFLVLMTIVAISFRLSSDCAVAAYVFSTIGSSTRQNLPLPMALESAATGATDERSRILKGIERWLVQGYSLSESIKRGYPRCPGYAVGMIAAAERIDQLPHALKAIEEDMVAKADERRKIRPVHPLYPVILMIFTFLVLLSLMTFVVPQFESVLTEMTEGATLPAPTRWLLGITSAVVYDYGWITWPALSVIVLVVVPVLIHAKLRPRRPHRPYVLSRISDLVKWHLPILHRFEKDYSMVQVVELLRLSLKAGCPINEAIRNALGLDVNNCFKKRLRRWLGKVERGDSVSAAARENKLGSPLAWAFDEKVNQGNTLSILETLESFYRSNYGYCVNLARFILWPCVTLVMGAIVGFVVLAIFSPLIAIITQLTSQVNP